MPIADSPNRCTRSLRINCLEDYLNRRKKHLSDCAFSGLYVSGCTQPFMKCSLTIISNFTFELIYLKQTRKHAEDAAPGRPKVVAAIFWSLEPLVSERSCCSRIQGLISAKNPGKGRIHLQPNYRWSTNPRVFKTGGRQTVLNSAQELWGWSLED